MISSSINPPKQGTLGTSPVPPFPASPPTTLLSATCLPLLPGPERHGRDMLSDKELRLALRAENIKVHGSVVPAVRGACVATVSVEGGQCLCQ